MNKVVNWVYPPLSTITNKEGSLHSILSSKVMKEDSPKLSVALGFDVLGNPVIDDLCSMTNLLITGNENTGKTSMIQTLLASLLFRNTPSDLRLIIIDPSRVELTAYNGIAHLLTPVITDVEKGISALRWALSEIDRRYKLCTSAGTRNIEGYNELAGYWALPYIVIFIDDYSILQTFSPVEYDDMMNMIFVAGKRAGIYTVLASKIIDKKLIKIAQSRIAFLSEEKQTTVLAPNDYLFIKNKSTFPICVQSPITSDVDVCQLSAFIKNQGIKNQYIEEVTAANIPSNPSENDIDDLFKQAVKIVCQYDKASPSLIQRRLSIGYARAARIIDQLEGARVVGPAEGSKPREVLVQDAEAYFEKHPNGI